MARGVLHVLRIEGMMCMQNCGRTVERALSNIEGVEKANVDFDHAVATVLSNVAVSELIEAVENVGFAAYSLLDTPPDTVFRVEGMMCQKNCGTTVQRAILGTPGVLWCEASFAEKTAKIWGNADVQSVSDALADAGFEGKEVFHGKLQSQGPLLAEPTEQPDYTLQIDGMTCQKCVMKVSTALQAVSGVLDLQVHLSRNVAYVWGFAELEEVIKAITSAGYRAQIATSPGELAKPVDSLSSYGSIETDSAKARVQSSSLNVADFVVSGMSCASCVKKIENSVLVIPGVKSARLALMTGKCEVSYEPFQASTKQISDVISALGYTVRLIGTEQEGSQTAQTFVLEVTGMSCAACSNKVERVLKTMPGVSDAVVSISTSRAKVVVSQVGNSAGPRDLVERVEALGYGCRLLAQDEQLQSVSEGVDSELSSWSRLLVIALTFGLPVVILHIAMTTSRRVMMMLNQAAVCGNGVNVGELIMLGLNVPMQFVVGARYYRAAYLSARQCSFGMDFLVVLGTTITFVYSLAQLFTSCITERMSESTFFQTSGMLLLFVTIGKYIEAVSRKRTCGAMTALLKLQPQRAMLILDRDDSSSALNTEVQEIDVAMVQRGDTLKVIAGARIPVDGVVVFGESYVDESMITGESVPVYKSVGETVFGGTVNQHGILHITALSIGNDTAIAQIVRLVQDAQLAKAPIQSHADKLAALFTPVVITLALVTFTVWCTLTHIHKIPQEWIDHTSSGDPFLFSMLFGISVIVISCPCALGLATPTAVMVGTSVGAAHGILIKGGPAFETSHRVDTVVFDKTGTLTCGKPCVTDVVPLPVSLSAQTLGASGLRIFSEDAQQVLLWAAVAEQNSEHPLGQAIVSAAADHELKIPPIESVVVKAGLGISCVTQGSSVYVGNSSWMKINGLEVPEDVMQLLLELQKQGKTAVFVAVNATLRGIVGIADQPKPEAFTTVLALRNMGLDVWMLTGDNSFTAEALARELDIPSDRVVADVLPAQKATMIQTLQNRGAVVAMVGDGINDSPALAQADMGIAVGAGTHIVMEAANFVLLRNNLHDVVVALHLAKLVFRRIKWNFMFATLYNIIAVPFAAGVFFPWIQQTVPPQYAGLSMACSSVSVVLSSLSLWLYKRPSLEMDVDQMHRWRSLLHRGSGAGYEPIPRYENQGVETAAIELNIV